MVAAERIDPAGKKHDLYFVMEASRRSNRAPLSWGLLTAGLLVLLVGALAGCSSPEREAKVALEAALMDSDQTSAELRRDLVRIVNGWPGTEAAGRAQRELESMDALDAAAARGQSLRAWDTVRRVANAAERYRLRHGKFPRSADALIPRYLERSVDDPWGNPVLYERTSAGYRVVSYGADGVPGGADEAADLLVTERDADR